ncbi:MAG: RNA polymerase sigma factor [Acidimicrobiia bacterium]
MSPPPGHEERFRLLFDGHLHDLKAYCGRRVAPDDVDDAVAEVFAVAWRRLEKVPRGDEARLWLYGVARNVVRNQTRSSRRRLRLDMRLIANRDPAHPGPAETVLTRSEHEDVVTALQTLKETDQELLRLRAWEELSRHEIAQVLGISVAAVDMRLNRAMARMSDALEAVTTGPRRDSIRRAEDRGGKP